MHAIYGNIYHQYTPNVSINLPLTWILWEMGDPQIIHLELGVQLNTILNHPFLGIPPG